MHDKCSQEATNKTPNEKGSVVSVGIWMNEEPLSRGTYPCGSSSAPLQRRRKKKKKKTLKIKTAANKEAFIKESGNGRNNTLGKMADDSHESRGSKTCLAPTIYVYSI